MAGSQKYFKYTADNGVTYAVRLDESNAELEDTGFTDLTDTDDGLTELPKGLKMRYVNCINSATGAARKIYCGLNTAERFISGGIILLSLIGNVAGAGAFLPFRITKAVGELSRLVNPIDTGLRDDDALD